MCIVTKRITFEQTETILTEALQNLGEYYERNQLRANPDKTQTCAYNKHLEHILNPVYMGVTLDRTLSYKEHIHKPKCKTSARNNILRRLSHTKWGTKPATIKTTALALCYFTAEYACPL